MIVDCLLTVLLVVTPATVGMERYLPGAWTYLFPVLSGVCVRRDDELAPIWVDDAHNLVFVHGMIRYEMPFPPKPGQWPMTYYLGADTADMGVWGRVMVRYGPESPT